MHLLAQADDVAVKQWVGTINADSIYSRSCDAAYIKEQVLPTVVRDHGMQAGDAILPEPQGSAAFSSDKNLTGEVEAGAASRPAQQQ